MNFRVLPDPPDEGDDSLHHEVQAMFQEEARKYKGEARPTRKIPPGYYDDKDYSSEFETHGLSAFKRELFEVKRAKHPHWRKRQNKPNKETK